MTEEEKYMKEALRQAKKAEKLGEVPIGCVIVKMGRSLQEGIIGGIRIKIPLLMQNFRRFERPARQWETGGWRNVLCTLHWNLVRCVPVPLYRQGFQES